MLYFTSYGCSFGSTSLMCLFHHLLCHLVKHSKTPQYTDYVSMYVAVIWLSTHHLAVIWLEFPWEIWTSSFLRLPGEKAFPMWSTPGFGVGLICTRTSWSKWSTVSTRLTWRRTRFAWTRTTMNASSAPALTSLGSPFRWETGMWD